MEEHVEQINGCVESIIFRNEENGFTVVELSYDNELITVVGEMNGVDVGEELTLTGVFTTHSTFGPQFKASVIHRNMPASATAILKYLSSGAVKGIGPVTARKFVDHFGDKTLEIMEKSPEMLCEIKGITRSKMLKISEEINRIFGIRTVMMFLANFNVSPAESVLIWKKWGLQTPDIISENPFVLCSYELGISFERADNIRARLGQDECSENRIKGALFYILHYNINSGHTCLPFDKLCQVACVLVKGDYDQISAILISLINQGELISEPSKTSADKNYIYLPSLYVAEKYCTSRLILALKNKPDVNINLRKQIKNLESSLSIEYDEIQINAITAAANEGVVVITGGPGTGKTTTVNAIISILESQGLEVTLAAPTGRAAKRLSDVTNREAKTIHRLLEAGFGDNQKNKFMFVRNEQNPIKSDAIIIDELSMVDILLLENLLKALPFSCRIIMVGDYNQLPSVGAGNVLRDIVASEVIPVVRLNKIFRQALKSAIVTNAHKIIEGQSPDLSTKDSDFFFMRSYNMQKSAQTVCDLCSFRLPNKYDFSPFWDIQVIAPSKKGEVGTIELNRKLQETLNPPLPTKPEIKHFGQTYRVGDKVMQTKNNYEIECIKPDGDVVTGVYNGDIGIIDTIDKASGLLTIKFEDKTAMYNTDLIGQLDLAYAITVHKSQGSEFEAVIIPLLPGHKNLYFRNLFYTAVTRAKKLLIIVGSENTITNMVENNKKSRRFSNFDNFLKEEIDFFN